QILDLARLESQIAQEVDRVVQPARDAVPGRKRILPKRKVKHRLGVGHAELPIPVGHRELIQVGQQGERVLVERARGARGHAGSVRETGRGARAWRTEGSHAPVIPRRLRRRGISDITGLSYTFSLARI